MWADKYTWWWAQALDWTGLEEEKKADREPQLIKSVSQELDHAGVDQSELSA